MVVNIMIKIMKKEYRMYRIRNERSKFSLLLWNVITSLTNSSESRKINYTNKLFKRVSSSIANTKINSSLYSIRNRGKV